MATSTPFPTSDTSPELSAGASSTQASSRDEVGQLTERVAGGAHAFVDRTVERLAPTVQRLRSTATEAGSALQARADELGALQQRVLDDSRERVRDRPLSWLAGAFVVGLVIGRLG